MANNVLIIPARMGSERFPRKPYAMYRGKPLLRYIYDKAKQLTANVVIAIDDQKEAGKVERMCGQAKVFVDPEPTCAMERVYSYFVKNSHHDMYMSWPVDEPEIQVGSAAGALVEAHRSSIPTSCYCQFWDREVLESNLSCKVTTSNNLFVYSSRSIIPGRKDGKHREPHEYKKHVGLFFFPHSWLTLHGGHFFSHKGETERLESLEQNRFADLQMPLRMVEIKHLGFGIDQVWQLQALEDLVSKEKRSVRSEES
jgi:CMP-2-keto-3-deoxyoctulosonic acid synthetase